MSTSFLVTQSMVPTPAPIVAGAYKWLFSGQRGDEQQIDIFQDFRYADLVSQQCEMFLDLVVDNRSLFRQLVDQWRVERGATSSTTEIVMCPSYHAIMGMGLAAVPLILAEIESEGDDPDQWFWALQVLAGSNPVPEEDEGDFKAMAQHWIRWARSRYAW